MSAFGINLCKLLWHIGNVCLSGMGEGEREGAGLVPTSLSPISLAPSKQLSFFLFSTILLLPHPSNFIPHCVSPVTKSRYLNRNLAWSFCRLLFGMNNEIIYS